MDALRVETSACPGEVLAERSVEVGRCLEHRNLVSDEPLVDGDATDLARLDASDGARERLDPRPDPRRRVAREDGTHPLEATRVEIPRISLAEHERQRLVENLRRLLRPRTEVAHARRADERA